VRFLRVEYADGKEGFLFFSKMKGRVMILKRMAIKGLLFVCVMAIFMGGYGPGGL
jgi:hypothetical protein